MKSLYLVSLALILAVPSFATAEQKVDVDIPAGGAQDMLNMTTIPSTISDHNRDYTIIHSCTNSAGRVIYEGEDSYASCIAATEGTKKGAKPQPSSAPGDASHVITIKETPVGN